MSGYKSFEFINNSGILNECFCEMLTSLLLLNGDGEILRIKTIFFFGIHVQIGAAKLGRYFFWACLTSRHFAPQQKVLSAERALKVRLCKFVLIVNSGPRNNVHENNHGSSDVLSATRPFILNCNCLRFRTCVLIDCLAEGTGKGKVRHRKLDTSRDAGSADIKRDTCVQTLWRSASPWQGFMFTGTCTRALSSYIW